MVLLTETNFIIATSVFLIFSLLIGWMVKHNFAVYNQYSYLTAALAWLDYIFLLTLTIFGAMIDSWQYEGWGIVSQLCGAILIIIGFVMTVLSMYQFGSLKRVSDLDQSKLITSGIYQYSRHPQNVGSILFCLGIALFFQSLYSLGLTTFYFIFFWIYAPLEEEHLETVFGEPYQKYKENTPRFLSLKNFFYSSQFKNPSNLN